MEFLALLLLVPFLFFGGDLFDSNGNDDDDGSTEGNDVLKGGNGADSLDGNGGNDVVDGAGGNDTLRGGDGDDSVYGQTGDDEIRGGDGNDVLLGFEGNDTLLGGIGADSAYGDAGDDEIWLGGGEDFVAEYLEDDPDLYRTEMMLGNDTIHGEGGSDYITDFIGANSVYGGDGDDFISVEDTLDELIHVSDRAEGGDGDDVLFGDSGDILVGGLGADVFVDFADERHENAVIVEDYDGLFDYLELQYFTIDGNPDPSLQLTARADPTSGDVTLTYDGIDLALLLNPANFDLQEVGFYVV